MNRTPLHDFHLTAGAKMVEFAGWEMPLTYEGLTHEHHHCRQHAAIFDVSHMGRVDFTGPDAEALLEKTNVRKVSGMPVGLSRYSHMCREDGGILDDVIVSRLEDKFFVVCNASNREKLLGWWKVQSAGMNVEMIDRTLETAMVALQGPDVIETLDALLPFKVGELKRYHCHTGSILGSQYFVARSGYTGEDGCEITLPASLARMAIDMLVSKTADAGKPFKPAGLAARDTLRTEAGMPLYGHELSEDWDPISAGQAWVVHWDKDFIGKAALENVRDSGPTRPLVGFEVDSKRTPRQGAKVVKDGGEVGVITSGITSPTLGKVIAMGFVDQAHSEPGSTVEIDLGKAQIPAKVVALPFYKRGK